LSVLSGRGFASLHPLYVFVFFRTNGLRLGSAEEALYWFAEAVAGNVEGALLHLVGQARRDAHGLVEGCVQILDDDRVLDGRAGALVGCHPVEVAFSDAATEQQHGAGVGEMPVHAVVSQLVDGVRHLDLVPHLVARLALDEHVPAELAGKHDQGAVEQSSLLEVEHELRDRGVDLPLQIGESRVAVLVRVPVQKRHVLGGQLDEARPSLD